MNTPNRPLRRMTAAFLMAACLFAGNAGAHAISGAIFTTDGDGDLVNGNNYDFKTDVYLNGGPNGGPCFASRLDDDDDYYFQVTDPSGHVLLSSDAIGARKFGVSSSGVIDGLGGAPAGTHVTGSEPGPCSNVTVQLMPFDDTPNPGGVYKVWITRVSDYVAGCETTVSVACGHFGFVPGHTKTDNFKAQDDCPVGTPGCDEEIDFDGALEAYKFYDANASGTFDAGDLDLAGWPMTLTSVNQGVDSTQNTASDGTALWDPLIPDNDYYVTEGTPLESNWVHSTTIYLGHDGSPQNPAGPLVVNANETTTVAFGNYCTVPSGGRTLGFWSNKNGQATMNDGGTLAPELALLVSYNLRNANGSHFDPATYPAFRTWLLNANATNMAYMLSAQLSAMVLNVEAGFVDGGAYYVPAGRTINQLMADANTSLGSWGYTPDGHAQRANQEQLKNWLDQLNNNAGVLSPTPCTATFD